MLFVYITIRFEAKHDGLF